MDFCQYYLTVLCFGSVDSVDCGSVDIVVVLVGLGDENKPANHPWPLVSDALLQHTAQIFHFIFIK